MMQKNLENTYVDIIYLPEKIGRSRNRRYYENRPRRVKVQTNCTLCGKSITPPFTGALCGNCRNSWDSHEYARIMARASYGKAIKCEKCGLATKKGIQWHHPDYSKPLEVIALCRKCHGKAHRLGEQFKNITERPRMYSLSFYDSNQKSENL